MLHLRRLIPQYGVDVSLVVQYIKTALVAVVGNDPAIASELEEILVEIADAIVVRLVYLADALGFNCLLHRLTVYLGIKRELNGVDNILVELLQVDVAAVL